MAKKIKVGVCALCRKPKRLQHSHVVSKFVWEGSGVTEGRNKFDLISLTDPKTSRFHQQDGIREYLCCKVCEGKMAKWEKVAAQVWFNEGTPFRHARPNQAGYFLDHIPYREMKLFLMSIIWRMGVSNDPFYCAVNLGADEPRLRRLLMAEDPGEPWRNGCMVSILTHNGLLLSDYFSQPAQWDSGNHPDHKFFCMVAAGVMLLFVVGARTPPVTTRGHYLKRGESWQIRAEEIKGYPPLWVEFQGWAKLNGFNL